MNAATDQTTSTDLTFGEMQQAALVAERIEEAARALFEEWTDLHLVLAKEFLAERRSWSEFEGAYEYIDYNAYRLDDHAINFYGTDRDGDLHIVSIPFAFIDLTTRPAYIEGLRVRYSRDAADAASEVAEREAARIERERRDLADEAARLGYALKPIADEG